METWDFWSACKYNKTRGQQVIKGVCILVTRKISTYLNTSKTIFGAKNTQFKERHEKQISEAENIAVCKINRE